MDEHPLAGLDEPGVCAVRQVVRGHALHAAGDGDVQGHLLGHRHALVRRHRRVLGVRLKHGGIGDAVAHLDALRLRLGRDRGHEAAALLPADERELALVQTAAVVRVDEVDARVLVRHEHAAGRQLGDGVVVLHLHHGRRAGLAHHGGALRGKRNERARNDGASAMAPEAVRRGYRAEAVASGRQRRKSELMRSTSVGRHRASRSRGGLSRTMTSGTEAKPRVLVSTWRATRDRRMADMVRSLDLRSGE